MQLQKRISFIHISKLLADALNTTRHLKQHKMWELRYLNSCHRQLVSCKSLASPQIQPSYWLLCSLRYSSWKQLCLGVLNWTESSIWEGIMWIFCQRNPKLNRGGWDFFSLSSLHFSWVCVVGKISPFNSEHIVKLFKKHFRHLL